MLSDDAIEAYAAGIFDGEGSLAVFRNIWSHKGDLEYIVTVSQKDAEVLDWLKEHFGGGVSFHKSGSTYCWRASGHRAYQFLKTIVEYSVVRKFDIGIMLNIWENRKDKELADKLIAERKQNLQNARIQRIEEVNNEITGN